MRIFKRQGGGYMSALEQSRPELYKTIKGYRDRLTTPEQKTFDKRANIQYKTTFNMPEQMRQAYFKSIEKQFAKPSEEQFKKLREDLKSERFTPTRQYYDESMMGPTRTSGYYRDLSPEIAAAEKALKGLTITEQKTGTRTPYTLQRSSSGAGLAGYTPPPPSKKVYELPKGYNREFRTSPGPYNTGGGQTAYGSNAPGQNTGPYGTYQPRDYYVKGAPEKYTYDVTRAQRAGDPEYDKQAAALKRLRIRDSFKNMPQFTGQGNLTSQNVYQQLGMAKSGGLKEDIQKIKKKEQKFSSGGRASVRGTKFKGVF